MSTRLAVAPLSKMRGADCVEELEVYFFEAEAMEGRKVLADVITSRSQPGLVIMPESPYPATGAQGGPHRAAHHPHNAGITMPESP